MGEGGVVDETDVLHPAQHLAGDLCGHVLGPQRLVELVPRTGLRTELAQDDRLRLSLLLGAVDEPCL